MRQARSTVVWLRHVARAAGQPVDVVAARIRTTRALAPEIGRLLNTNARREAEHLVATDGRPPTTAGIVDDLVRGHYAVLFEAKKKAANSAASQALAAEARQERKKHG